jgi:hypothetical protein
VTFAVAWLCFGLASFRAGIYPRRIAVFMAIGGLAGALSLMSPFQVSLALAVGWTGIWLARSAARGPVQAASLGAAA